MTSLFIDGSNDEGRDIQNGFPLILEVNATPLNKEIYELKIKFGTKAMITSHLNLNPLKSTNLLEKRKKIKNKIK